MGSVEREAGQSQAEMLVKSRHYSNAREVYGGKETGLGTGHEPGLVTLRQTN